MKYLQFVYSGVNKYIDPNNAVDIQKAYELGYRPLEDENGNYVLKELLSTDTIRGVEDDDVKAMMAKLNKQLKSESKQEPKVADKPVPKTNNVLNI